jgi:hypothetical protein
MSGRLTVCILGAVRYENTESQGGTRVGAFRFFFTLDAFWAKALRRMR